MTKIKILDSNTANQIAAGEVVERPSSVVKELCENALDAEANIITIRIQNGGIKKIQISDNGAGMSYEDCLMAIKAHATSKISSIDEINHLSTMGFRGEALASIASVSKLNIISREIDSDAGTSMTAVAGKIIEHKQDYCSQGTTITVTDLFFNTPARYKFLKKDSTEASKITRVVTELALSRPDVSFRLFSQNEEILHSPGNNDLLSTIYSLFGNKIGERMLEIIPDPNNTCQCSGYIGACDLARKSRIMQFIFVNNRIINSKLISKATEDAYREFLVKGLFPIFFLKLDLPGAYVDINVHPQKSEVRFWNDNSIYKSVYQQIKNSLLSNLSKMHSSAGEFKSYDSNVNFEAINSESSNIVNNKQNTFDVSSNTRNIYNELYHSPTSLVNNNNEILVDDILKIQDPKHTSDYKNSRYDLKTEFTQNNLQFDSDENRYQSKLNYQFVTEDIPATNSSITSENSKNNIVFPPAEDIFKSSPFDLNSNYDNTDTNLEHESALFNDNISKHFDTDINNHQSGITFTNVSRTTSKDNDADLISELRDANYIGQLFQTYLIFEKGEYAYLVDQHAAHEKVLYERFREQYLFEKSSSKPAVQDLLVPLKLDMLSEIQGLDDKLSLFESLGFEFIKKQGDLYIKALPSNDLMNEKLAYDLLQSILDNDIYSGLVEENKRLDLILATMACKAAVKAHDYLSKEEVELLIKDMQKLKNPYHCPHGRPVLIKKSRYYIDKLFQRVVN